MSALPDARIPAVSGLPAWIPQLARGVLAIALGVTITLTLDHSATFGLLAFGVFATVTGAVLLLGSSRGPYAGSARPLFLGHGAVSLVAGIAALAAPFAGVPYLALVVGVFALLTGGLELTSGLRTRRSAPAARDWILVGAATVVLGVVALLLPTDLAEPFAGEKGVAGTLTSSIVLIGVLGAWAVVVGVLQTISAVSLRGARTTRVGAP